MFHCHGRRSRSWNGPASSTTATDLVFPTATGRMLPDSVLSGMLRQLNIDCVPHGFRSSFRDWCGEKGIAREVAEACLSHQVKNEVEAAYARSDLLERRREVMQLWADYVTG